MSLKVQDGNALRERKIAVPKRTATVKTRGNTLAVCDENAPKLPRKTSNDLKTSQGLQPDRIQATEPRPASSRATIRPDNPPKPLDLEDIDADEGDYLEFCSVYVKRIYDHLFENESKFTVRADFLKGHPEVVPKMRILLIEWLLALQDRFKLLQDTLLLSVSIMDRTLSATSIKIDRANFQLLGATCLWIASKYEEMYSPSVGDFCYMCAGTYTQLEFREMEARILTTLGFEFSKPLSSHFLRRFSKAAGGNLKTHVAAKYLIELSLFSYKLASCLPSLIAAAALFVAGHATGEIIWDEAMQFHCRYRTETLRDVAYKLTWAAVNADKEKYFKRSMQKYSCEKYYLVPALFTAKFFEELFPHLPKV